MKLCGLAADFGKFWGKSSRGKKKLMGNLGEVFNFSLSIKNDHQDRDDDGSIHASDAIVVARCVLDIIIIIITVLFFFLLTSLSLVAVKEKNEEKKRKQQLRER